eukprot:scaffold208114_cov26-Tisochrysis_lutea.AAC.1
MREREREREGGERGKKWESEREGQGRTLFSAQTCAHLPPPTYRRKEGRGRRRGSREEGREG